MVQFSQQDLDNMATFKRVQQDHDSRARKTQEELDRYWNKQRQNAKKTTTGRHAKAGSERGSAFGVYLATGVLLSLYLVAFNEFFYGQDRAALSFVLGMSLAIPICAWRPLFVSFFCAFGGMFAIGAILGLAGVDRFTIFPISSLSFFPLTILFLAVILGRRQRKTRDIGSRASSKPE